MMERTMYRLILLSLVATALSAEEFIHQRSVAQLLPPNKDKCTDCKRSAEEYCNRNEMSDTECNDYGDQQCRDDCKAECSKCKERIIYMCQKEELGEEECEERYSEECKEKCSGQERKRATRIFPSCRRCKRIRNKCRKNKGKYCKENSRVCIPWKSCIPSRWTERKANKYECKMLRNYCKKHDRSSCRRWRQVCGKSRKGKGRCLRRCLQAQMRKCKRWVNKGCIYQARTRCRRKCTGRLMKRK